MASLRIDLDNAGIRQAVLTSPEVRAALRQIAEATAARARSGTKREVKVTEGGRERARVYVSLEGYGAATEEARTRILGRSLTNGG